MQITLLHLFFPSVNFASRPTVDDTSVFSNNCNKTILYCSFIVASLQLHCSCCSEDSFIMPPPVGKGHKALPLSVRPSVRPSVAYIANNSRTQRPSAPKFGTKVPHLYQTSIPLSRSKGQRSRSPGSLMLTHILRHISQCQLTAYRWMLLFGVFLGYFCINLHQTGKQYSMRDRRIAFATMPNFRKSFYKSRFFRRKTVLCPFLPSFSSNTNATAIDR